MLRTEPTTGVSCRMCVPADTRNYEDGSRKSVFANTYKPELRYRMLRFDTDAVEPCENILERYEKKRPRSLESLSLGEFAVNYKPLNSKMFREDDDGDSDSYPSDNDEKGTH